MGLNVILRPPDISLILTMFFLPTSAALNHLLAQNSWAMKRLAQFSGKIMRFDVAPFSIAYVIQPDGSVLTVDSTTPADAVCDIAPTLIPRLSLREESAYSEIRHEGDSALFAEVVALIRELRWDITEDLSHVTGDIAAERIAQTILGTHHQLRDAAVNFSEAAAEYWTEERPLLVKPGQITEFGNAVESLRDEVIKLEQRLNHLLAADKP